jgi:hypothetical protein
MYEQATENLALYANANNQKLIGCEPQDDDLDGYVSCFTQENAARAADVPPSSVPTKKHRLECGYLWNKGCFERSGGATKPAQF